MRFILLLLFPALELYILVKAGAETGALNMVLWVFASAAIGLWAVRAQGQETVNRARADMAAGRVPQDSFLDGLLLFLGGVLLILPGLISDAAGLFLLLPPARRWASSGLSRYLGSRQTGAGGATRVFFFKSGPPGHGPFAGGPFAPRSGPFPSQDGRSMDEHDWEQDPGPRQATIIESTAIEIHSAKTDGPGGGAKPDDADTGANNAEAGGTAGKER